jgi:hypothetical protein
LDLLVLFIKNWPDASCVGIGTKKGLGDMEGLSKGKEKLLNVLHAEFLDVVECYVQGVFLRLGGFALVLVR